jgi:hypothetical protein
MPSFVYQGLPKKQQEARLKSVMAPLMDDYRKHPRLGGFPDGLAGNPNMYYPEADDSPAAAADKEKRRKEYRARREEEVKAGIKDEDAVMVLWGVEFRKGEAVELDEKHPLLQPVKKRNPDGSFRELPSKMDAMLERGVFKESKGMFKGPGRPKKEKDED